MKYGIKTRVLAAFRKLLGAIIRLALRNGVSYPQLSAIIKSLYIEIAAAEYGLQGRKTNDSGIALITGLDRREIKKVKSLEASNVPVGEQSPDRMAKVLSGWY